MPDKYKCFLYASKMQFFIFSPFESAFSSFGVCVKIIAEIDGQNRDGEWSKNSRCHKFDAQQYDQAYNHAYFKLRMTFWKRFSHKDKAHDFNKGNGYNEKGKDLAQWSISHKIPHSKTQCGN